MKPTKEMVKIIISLILVVAFSFMVESSYGQNSSVIITPWNKTDTVGYGVEIKRLIVKANGLAQVKFETALIVLDSALALIKIAPDLRKYTVYLGNRGLILVNNGRNNEAGCLLDISIALANKYRWTGLERALINVQACNYLYLAKYDSALHFGLKYLNQAASAQDADHLFIGYNNLGILYYKLYDARNALLFYTKAEAIRKDQKVDQLYLNIGLCYNFLEKYDSALLYYDLAHKTSPAHDNAHMIHFHFGVGLAFSHLKKYDSARFHLREAKRIATIKEDERFVAESASILGEIAVETGDFSGAKYQLRHAEFLTEKNSLNAVAQDNYLRMAILYKAIGDLNNQTLYQARYIKHARVVYHEELLSKIALIENGSNESANIKRIDAQKSLLTMQNGLAELRNMVLVLVCVVGGLLLVVFIFLIIVNQKKSKINTMLEHLVEEQTIDLEMSYKTAASARDGFDHGIKVLTNNLKAQFATLKGFCFVGISESNDDEKELLSHVFSYINEIEGLGGMMSE